MQHQWEYWPLCQIYRYKQNEKYAIQMELFSLQTVPVPYHPNRKFSDKKHASTWLKPDHDILAMNSSTNLALD